MSICHTTIPWVDAFLTSSRDTSCRLLEEMTTGFLDERTGRGCVSVLSGQHAHAQLVQGGWSWQIHYLSGSEEQEGEREALHQGSQDPVTLICLQRRRHLRSATKHRKLGSRSLMLSKLLIANRVSEKKVKVPAIKASHRKATTA
ncbi:uncharacterized protein ARMOST_12509 [Armillaria ostoyae]|uniref:Uncharacterized protein n=1 Tax=Armillaria ostoyae TaxID=47428 RepID=A0A284RK50_ARMOS|nr:uncharacterized protein ARMOST_12509 [Armillaria ostoyae]